MGGISLSLLALMTLFLNLLTRPVAEEPDIKGTPDITVFIDVSLNCIIGGWDGENWISDSLALANLKNKKFKIYTQKGFSADAKLKKTYSDEAPCEYTFFADWENPPQIEGYAVAVNCERNVMPRIPKEIKSNNTHKAMVASMLKTLGFKNPKVKITEIFEIDIDGDGNQETIISATNYIASKGDFIGTYTKKGDYSIVMMLKTIGSETEKVLILGDLFPKEEEYTIPYVNTVHSFTDLNGDGILEILIDSKYYEGESVGVYTLNGDKPLGVLGCGCGA